MTRYLAILAAAMLVGCSGDKSGDSSDSGAVGDDDDGPGPGDDDDDVTGSCTNAVITRFPVSGDSDVYYKTDVRFGLTVEEGDATIEVTDGAGNVVAGTTTVEGPLVTWNGDDDLAPETAYSATLSYSCGSDLLQFTTSVTGGETIDVTGRVYALDLAGGDWVKPAGVGGLLATQLGDTQVLVSATSVSDTEIVMLGAIGAAGVQDICTPSLAFPPAEYENPYFELSSPLLPLVVAGLTVEIEDLDLSGAFDPNGDRIQGVALQGTIDTRVLAGAFPDLGTTDNAICTTVAAFGVACEDCSDGTPYCLSVYIDAVEAPYLSGASLVERTEDDVANDPGCQ